MAKYVSVTDLSDSTLFDADGFPLDSTNEVINDQRKSGTNTWNKNTKVGHSIWNSAGEQYDAIERVPYHFDLPLNSTGFTITSGAGPVNDINGYLRSEIPIDASITLRCVKDTTAVRTVATPAFNLNYKVDGYAKLSYLDLDDQEYSMTSTVTWPNPNNILETITATKVIAGTSKALLNYDDADEVENRNKFDVGLLTTDVDGFIRPDMTDYNITAPTTASSSTGPERQKISVTIFARSTNVVTATIATGHGLIANDVVTIVGIGAASGFSIEDAVIVTAGATTVTWAQTGSDETVSASASHLGYIYFERWTLSVAYTNTITKIAQDTGDVSPYTIAYNTAALEDKMYMTVIVAPFTRLDATEVTDATARYIGSKEWFIENKAAGTSLFSDYDQVKRDMKAIFAGYGSTLSELVVYTNVTTNSISCVQKESLQNDSPITITVSGTIANPTSYVTYTEIDNITGISITDTTLTNFDYNAPTTTVYDATSTIDITDISLGDIVVVDIKDELVAEFTSVDIDNDTYQIVIKSINVNGLVVEYEPFKLIIKRIKHPDDDLIYIRSGYYWIGTDEKYLYNNPIEILNKAVTAGIADIDTEIGTDEILEFSKIQVYSDSLAAYLNYDFNIDDTTGIKSLTGLTESFYFDDNKIYVSSDVTGNIDIKLQPNDDIYINSSISVNPLLSWKRRYFVEYSEYTQTLTSILVDKFNSLLNVYCYDQYGNPISGVTVTLRDNDLSTRTDANFRLLDETSATYSYEVSGTSNDEGRKTAYYLIYSNNAGLVNNECKITAAYGAVTLTNIVTLNNTGTEITNNSLNDWSIVTTASPISRIGATYTAPVKIFDYDGDSLAIESATVALYYKLTSDTTWVEDTVTVITLSDANKTISFTPPLNAMYKIEITPLGYSEPKYILFRSY